MKHIVMAVSMTLLILEAVAAVGQSSAPKPAPEPEQSDVWLGDWVFSGTAKDTLTEPEYKVDWQMHWHTILGGFFAQGDSIWKGNGQEVQTLEIADRIGGKKTHSVIGFASDGSTWVSTSTFDHGTSIVNETTTNPDGTITTCRITFFLSSDGMSASGKEECEANGVRWTGFQVNGTKAKLAGKK